MVSNDRFVKALQRKTGKVSTSAAKGRYGRLVRSLKTRPVRLAEEAGRRVVMVMGPGALSSLTGKEPYDMLVEIGHTREYIAHKLSQGYKFHLVFFDRPQDEMRLATWNNSLELIASQYPQAASMIRAARRVLKNTSFEEFEAQAGFSLAEVDRLGSGDKRFMTYKRLLKSDGSALSVRRFLYHVTRLTELYSGDGYTWTVEGQRGVREYIMANRAIRELKGNRLYSLEVKLPKRQ